MRARLTGLLVLATLALAGAPALAASGKALGVDPAAEARRASAVRVLTVGADVAIGERIVTGPSGQVQILFDDRTELVVGPNSALLIEDYLLREDGSAGRLAINALAGTFRFVTGGAPKDRYSIKTPTGTIGVRGTAFELYITQAWTYILVQHGSVIGTNKAGDKSMVLEVACEIGQISLDDALVLGHADQFRDRDRLREMFMYAANQQQLLREFRISQAERCLNRPAPGGQGDGPGNDDEPTTSTPPTPTPTPTPKPGPILTLGPSP